MIFDIIIFLLFIGSIYLGYKYGTSVELLRLAKVFLGISLASAYSSDFGVYLTHIGLLKANDWAVLTLTGFLLFFALYWVFATIGERVAVKMNLQQTKANKFLGAFSNGLQAILMLTFLSFMSTQLTFVKEGYKTYLVENSMVYLKMDRACRKIVTGEFVDALKDDITGTSAKEVLIKTFSDKNVVKDILKDK